MTSSGSSSSSGAGQSDDDEFVVAPPAPPAPPATPADLGAVQELAQICHFCATFRAPLKLSGFTRTELQAALLDAANPNESQLALLAELHFKLTRDQTGVKLERMIQDWEKAVARKLAENWQLEFPSNPMANTSYAELSVLDRIHILNALCLWKAESCVEIRKYIATVQKDDRKAFDRLRGSEIGTDDKGVSYWYFDDGCWVYAEDKPQWQLEKREPQYVVEFANGKRIRLSINFDADSVPADHHQHQLIAVTKIESMKDILSTSNQDDNDAAFREVPDEKHAQDDVKVKRAKFSILNEEKEEVPSPTTTESVVVTTAEVAVLPPAPAIKEEVRPVSRKMDITMICGSPSSDDMSAKSEPQQVGNGQVKVAEKLDVFSTTGNVKTEQQANGFDKVDDFASQPSQDLKPLVVTFKAETKENQVENEVSQNSSKSSPHREDSALLGNVKKRVIVDDDNSDSSDVGDAKKTKSGPRVKQTSSPQKKKQKTEPDTAKETPDAPVSTAEKKDTPVPTPSNDSAVPEKVIDVKATTTTPADKIASKGETQATDSNGAIAEPTSTENFDINCECCQKDYDMRYLDPPLVERPAGEWRCFECLVNDARGWPRRRKSTASPTSKAEPAKEKSKLSSKKSNSSSSAKRSRPSSTKSSSGKTTSSGSSSKRTKSSGNSTSASKKSSSSSKKKHKKKKSSSSSHSHHRSSSSHHRRRHHQEYSKLLVSFQTRNKERLSIEEYRIHDTSRHNVELLESPTSWRVMSSTLDSLRGLIETLTGGSLEQERLRSRLISILKIQEKLEEERIKRQELAWQILPRRQSSRIAIGKMRNQSSGSEGSEDDLSDEETGKGRRRTQRSSSSRTRSADMLTDATGVDSKQQLALERASRARRRQIQEEMDGNGADEDGEEDENPNTVSPGDWINWSVLKGNKRNLTSVCLAAVNRLLKEEISELFARPVDPEFDGCPDYLTIITHPMDLGTIRTRLGTGFYKKWEAFKTDVDLVWKNCREFNGTETVISDYADTLEALFKQMCKVAEKRGVRTMGDDSGVDNGGASDDGHDDEHVSSSGDESKAESRTSVNKEWTESSGSESSGGSSDDDSDNSSDNSAGGKAKGKATRSARNRAPGRAKQQPTRPSPSGSAAAARPSRTRARIAKPTTKRASSWRSEDDDDDDDDDDESELSLSDCSDEDVFTRGRRGTRKPAAAAPARATRTPVAATGRQVSPSSLKKPRNAPAQQASPKSVLPKKAEASVPGSPPPPPPPAQVEEKQQQKPPAASGKSPRPLAAARPSRLRISDDSSSSDSDDGKATSSSSSSSSSSDDSGDSDSDSDTDLHAAPPQPTEPQQSPVATKKTVTAPKAAAPPPPPPANLPPPPPPPSPPRATAATVGQPPPPPKEKQRATKQPAKAKAQKSNASNKKSKVSPRVAALKLDNVATLNGGLTSSSYANSPTLLNSYLSPSSSSSSYFSSSAESDSSDSDSDVGGSD